MQGEHSKQSSFFGMIYEDFVPADHLLSGLSAVAESGLAAGYKSGNGACGPGQPVRGVRVRQSRVRVAKDQAG